MNADDDLPRATPDYRLTYRDGTSLSLYTASDVRAVIARDPRPHDLFFQHQGALHSCVLL